MGWNTCERAEEEEGALAAAAAVTEEEEEEEGAGAGAAAAAASVEKGRVVLLLIERHDVPTILASPRLLLVDRIQEAIARGFQGKSKIRGLDSSTGRLLSSAISKVFAIRFLCRMVSL